MLVHKRANITVSMIGATQCEYIKPMIASQSLNPLVERTFRATAGQIVKQGNPHK
jgi:hypothetical protein